MREIAKNGREGERERTTRDRDENRDVNRIGQRNAFAFDDLQ